MNKALLNRWLDAIDNKILCTKLMNSITIVSRKSNRVCMAHKQT